MQNILPWINATVAPWIAAHWNLWTLFGLAGQSLFMMRFIVQWIASERAKESVMPEMFWYFSLGGGLMVLVYAIHQQEPVFILGQLPGVFVYSRNLYFIHKRKQMNAR
jgi:lipid-A-disaccharide synthase-like uncharacterized protein